MDRTAHTAHILFDTPHVEAALGAWGPSVFEDDQGLEGVADLAEGTTTLRELFGRVNALPPDGFLGVNDAVRALAAAEVVAAMLGRPHPKFFADERSFLDGAAPPDNELLLAAANAIDRVVENSELAELWAESSGESWAEEQANLRLRISQPSM